MSHMVLGRLETVSFNDSLRFEIWIEIQGYVGVGLMVLDLAGEDIERVLIATRRDFWMRHGCSVSSSSVNKLLLEVFQLKNHGFGFIGDSCNEILKGVSDAGDNGFRLVPAQDVHYFYMRSHFSALQNCAVLFSNNFQIIFLLKKCITQFSH